MILLDTSVLIDLFRKKEKENSFFYSLLDYEEDFAISAVTHYEIGIGNKKSKSNYWNHVYENLAFLDFNQSASDMAIDIYLNLKMKNKLIDIADILIASVAMSNEISLATLNIKHFERIDGLNLIN
ncbi:type II toxin-antitoxin system VapC family toxin [Marivirga sp.]|uniref:type II toxin-antitoxin system VapC family toxin n=1 Tax=Marivirga sp. TaxID=2018662 RepID=UPI003DA7606C